MTLTEILYNYRLMSKCHDEKLLPDGQRFERVAALVGEGFGNRLLLSTDICRLSQLRCFGGRGFDYLFTNSLPGLKQAGVPEEHLRQMTVTNPAQVLTRLN